MTSTHGFELIREQSIPELNTTAKFYRHLKTGAELISMENNDENKVFGITFPTPPEDSTGLPHILEHCVLNGSRKYPVKQPFFELIKGSLQTFVNAMTFSDKTTYPVASQNLQDFYNLIDVYLDAVFHPQLGPQILEQEGWHFELENPDDPLAYRGVVFNEMKGAYSSPDDILETVIEESLFPDNAYHFDAGGDPTQIPNLTYTQFKKFYDTHYHPSNAKIWFYGDDNPDERLRIINAVLNEFEAREIDVKIPYQKPFGQAVQLRRPYVASSPDDKAFITVNWVWPDTRDPLTVLSLGVLSHILISTSASPLRKALIESGLGEDLAGTGHNSWVQQMTFSTGMRGVALSEVTKVEALIFDTLWDLVQSGLDKETIAASMNTFEFQLRELNTGSFPRGILLMLISLATWLFDGDPFAPLAFEKPLTELKQKIAEDPRYFEKLIQKHLLDNTHRSTIVLEPDAEMTQRLDEDEKARLEKLRSGMTEKDIQNIIESTTALKLRQQTPDSPEALAVIPRLTLNDLDKEIKTVPLEIIRSQGSEILYHDIFTNGIVYLDVAFNMHALPQDLIPYVSLLGSALLEMGTDKETYVQLTQRIGSKTGGISASDLITTTRGKSNEDVTWFLVRGKSTVPQVDDLLAILADVLLTATFDDKERFRQIVLEEKAGLEAGLIPSGHIVTMRRLNAHFTLAGWVDEQMSGISYLIFLRQLLNEIEQNWAGVLEKLNRVRELLVNRNLTICNITLDAANWAKVQPKLNEFLAKLPAAPVTLHTWTLPTMPTMEGLTIPAHVNYVGKGANLYQLGYKPNGTASVVSKYLTLAYVIEHVRVQGGAYSGFNTFNPTSGAMAFLSYRDPNLLNTIQVYDNAPNFLRQLDLSASELTAAIIGMVSDLDSYELPDAKGYSSMVRHLTKYTDEMRQQFRNEVLGTTAADFKQFGEALAMVAEQGHVVVLGSQQALEAANAEKGGHWLDVTKVL